MLGHTREALAAAQTNLIDWLRILMPFVWSRIYNMSTNKGNMYYSCALLVLLGHFTFLMVDLRSLDLEKFRRAK